MGKKLIITKGKDENELVADLRAALKANVPGLDEDRRALLVDDFLMNLGRLVAFAKERPMSPGFVAALLRFYDNLNLDSQVEDETDGRAVLTLVAATSGLKMGTAQ